MSTLYDDNLQPNLGSKVEIPDFKPPAGMVLNVQLEHQTTGLSTIASTLWQDIPDGTFNYTPKAANSLLHIDVVAHVYANQSDWESIAVRCLVDGNLASTTPDAGDGSHYGMATYGDRVMGYAIDASYYTLTSLSAVSIRPQCKTIQGSGPYVNYYGIGYVKVTEIAQ